jgi:hypothetical protein
VVLLSLARQILEQYLKQGIYILSAHYSLSPYLLTLHSARCFQRRKTSHEYKYIEDIKICVVYYQSLRIF